LHQVYPPCVRAKIIKHGQGQLYDSEYPLLICSFKPLERGISIPNPSMDDSQIERRDISLPGQIRQLLEHCERLARLASFCVCPAQQRAEVRSPRHTHNLFEVFYRTGKIPNLFQREGPEPSRIRVLRIDRQCFIALRNRFVILSRPMKDQSEVS
jgi:hypothetical protein